MGDIIEFKPKEKKEDFRNTIYEVDRFTMLWEDCGLSYEGTLQIDYLTSQLDEDSTIQRWYVRYSKV